MNKSWTFFTDGSKQMVLHPNSSSEDPTTAEVFAIINAIHIALKTVICTVGLFVVRLVIYPLSPRWHTVCRIRYMLKKHSHTLKIIWVLKYTNTIPLTKLQNSLAKFLLLWKTIVKNRYPKLYTEVHI